MFYCKPCGVKNSWPVDVWMFQSRGPCEICGKTAACFDVPCSQLPIPPDQDAEESEAVSK